MFLLPILSRTFVFNDTVRHLERTEAFTAYSGPVEQLRWAFSCVLFAWLKLRGLPQALLVLFNTLYHYISQHSTLVNTLQ